MPQITVNEIDQSVVTRVVTDDKVKILCPIIASFGPVYDETQESIKTFTDVTDFNRAFGYTYAEFNPFQDDHSRMYARELIKKGAAVSVVRVNNGYLSTFDIGPADRTSASYSTVCDAAFKATPQLQGITGVSETTLHTELVPGTITLKLRSSESTLDKEVVYTVSDYQKDGKFYVTTGVYNNLTNSFYSGEAAEVDYATGVVTLKSIPVYQSNISFTIQSATFNYVNGVTDWTPYTFCPQIAAIQAKYTGSFGNNIAISIAQVNTSRLSESYQYASISVYYINKITNYTTNDSGSTVVKQSVKSVTLLENKLVSTNPDDPNYFEDVEFDFIKITASSNAREDLKIIWSNIQANPVSGTTYAGFPVIPLKYTPSESKAQVYNFDAFMSDGADFLYSTDTLNKLRKGFKGYWAGSGWTNKDVTNYIDDVYGDGTEQKPGIIPTIYGTLSTMYGNYTDPYIYDFDFITSSGFVYEEFDTAYGLTTESLTLTGETTKTATFTSIADENGSVTIKAKTTGDVDVTYTASGTKLYNGSSEVGTITYTDGGGTAHTSITIDADTASGIQNSITVVYNDTAKAKVVTPKVPLNAESDLAYYTSVTPIHESMRNLVNTRQDCIALFDVPYNYDKNAIVDYSYILNTSYGTIHNPWCYVNSPDIAGQEILMAPSYIFLYTFLSNLINNVESQKWFPPAGVERATARVVTRPYYEIGSVILNDWQNDNISRVNPIMKLKQYGYVIYGQYTTLPAIDLYTHSALESLNVRLISNVVKKKIFDTCLNLAFEPNTSALWLKFFAQLDPFLRYMKYNDGLYDYRIVMDESTVTTDDINHLRCPGKVYIAPTRTAEFFDIDFIITDAGAVFSD